MISERQTDMVTINLNGVEVEVPNGINAVEAAALHGREVPHYCYHPKLSVAGNCRMCLIEMGTPMRDRATGDPILDEDGTQKIGWVPKPVIGCATNVSSGMHIRTESDLVSECREGIMEFLLVNHPLDCPICDQAGECRLQEFATDYGRGYSRYVERKNVKPKRTRLGPRVTLDDERCILCSRCIRFCQEVPKDDVLGFVDRGSFSTLTCFPGKELSNNYSLNTVDICPVGALTSTDFRFKMRVWFLKESPSICAESSAGCNTLVSSREGEIQRITPRRNDLVNDTWMTDSGRSLYEKVKSSNRILRPTHKKRDVPMADALGAALDLLKVKKIGVVASCNSTLEEQILLKRIIDCTNAQIYIRGYFAEDDGILLSADRTPNLRGALISGLTNKYPADHLENLQKSLDNNELDALLIVGEDIIASGISEESLISTPSVYLGTHHNETTKLSHVVLPGLTVFEKDGTFINRSFLAQSFRAAIPSPIGLSSDIDTLLSLLSGMNGTLEASVKIDLSKFWDEISAADDSPLHKIRFDDTLNQSIQLDSSPWSDLPFVEKKALHFEPLNPAN